MMGPGFYTPFMYPPLSTTYVDNTFPAHHWPLEHTRKAVGHAVHDFFNVYEGQPPNTPRCDVRETLKHFYIEVELPGLQTQEQINLVWISNNSLYLKGTITRPEIPLNDDEKDPKVESKNQKAQMEEPVHFHDRERGIGNFTRSFMFVVDVNRETMTAKLANGVLRIVVEKMPHEQIEQKEVKIQHASDVKANGAA